MLSTMSGIQETNNKSWLKLVFVCICVFVHRNKSKRPPVLTVPSLPFILGGIPIAEREKGGITELQVIQKELYVTAAYFIFFSHLRVSYHYRYANNICGGDNLL